MPTHRYVRRMWKKYDHTEYQREWRERRRREAKAQQESSPPTPSFSSSVSSILNNERLMAQLRAYTTREERYDRLRCFHLEPDEIALVLKALGEYR